MLGKLFKYEFKAMSRKLVPFYALVLLVALVHSVFTGFTQGSGILNGNTMLFVVYSVMFSLFVISLIAISIFTFIVIIQRFSRNILGKEGYLMHTLPVSVPQHIFVKTVTATVFYIIDAVIFVIAVLMLLAGMGANFGELFKIIAQNINKLPSGTFIFILNVSVMMIFATVYSILSIYTAMSIGYTSNSHKIACSIGVYILIYIMHNILSHVLMIIMMPILSKYSPANVGAAAYMKFMNIWFMGINVFLIAVIAVLAAVSCYFVKNKLNLV